MSRRRRLTLCCLSTLLVAACRPAAPPTAPPPIENRALGLRWSELPAGVAVATNQGPTLELRAGDAAITFAVAAEDPVGVDLVAVTKAYRDVVVREGGKVFGAAQLVAPTGPAFTTRAERAGAEERTIFLLHPDGGGRLVTLTSRYPTTDPEGAKRRMETLLELVATLEPVPPMP